MKYSTRQENITQKTSGCALRQEKLQKTRMERAVGLSPSPFNNQQLLFTSNRTTTFARYRLRLGPFPPRFLGTGFDFLV
ncbi:MAG TPA: hypothetical protein VD905_18480, partial [Flavobacteriales bacterium]|nr:hypothetical protein [Flavobacteriales bacterium]